MLFMSGSSDEVQLPLSALRQGFALLNSLNWFWDSSACLDLFWTPGAFWGLLDVAMHCMDSLRNFGTDRTL